MNGYLCVWPGVCVRVFVYDLTCDKHVNQERSDDIDNDTNDRVLAFRQCDSGHNHYITISSLSITNMSAFEQLYVIIFLRKQIC